MYVFKPDDIASVTRLKRSKMWRFHLRCGALIYSAAGAYTEDEVCVDSDRPIDNCYVSACSLERCLVQTVEGKSDS